ncbi:MAG: hypothetical protein A2173_03250 [Planctomycetes bacterium RBG_13_44_8b]|nr:MAG: hypothetical protein A2173_03250 [Planctomycetes bacterium RBG_13_44_8b]
MTRRKFIQKVLQAGSATIIGISWMVKKAVPRKYIRARKLEKYPGSIKSLHDICKQNNWSG